MHESPSTPSVSRSLSTLVAASIVWMVAQLIALRISAALDRRRRKQSERRTGPSGLSFGGDDGNGLKFGIAPNSRFIHRRGKQDQGYLAGNHMRYSLLHPPLSVTGDVTAEHGQRLFRGRRRNRS